jgi:hypothetical protein
MPWVRLDDGFPEHPKIVTAGGDAAWLHVCALGYCNRNLTDGHVPKDVLGRLSDRKSPKNLAKILCEVGLWTDDGDHWSIHDYLDFQPTAESVKAEREQAKERQKRHREKLRHADVTDMSQRDNGVSHGDVTPLVTQPRPDPTRPLSSDLQKSVLPEDSLQISGAVDNQAHPGDPVSLLSRRLGQRAEKDGFTKEARR